MMWYLSSTNRSALYKSEPQWGLHQKQQKLFGAGASSSQFTAQPLTTQPLPPSQVLASNASKPVKPSAVTSSTLMNQFQHQQPLHSGPTNNNSSSNANHTMTNVNGYRPPGSVNTNGFAIPKTNGDHNTYRATGNILKACFGFKDYLCFCKQLVCDSLISVQPLKPLPE